MPNFRKDTVRKLKKKSLVGWTNKNWTITKVEKIPVWTGKTFVNRWGRMFPNFIRYSKLKGDVRVKVTIEEVK